MTRVLIVDDHTSIRRGLQVLIDAEADLEVCGTADSGEAALALVQTLSPDVVVMDLSMPGMGGRAATEAIAAALPGCRVLILSWHWSEEHLVAAVRAGATGYVVKGTGPATLMDSLRAVARGELWLDSTPF